MGLRGRCSGPEAGLRDVGTGRPRRPCRARARVKGPRRGTARGSGRKTRGGAPRITAESPPPCSVSRRGGESRGAASGLACQRVREGTGRRQGHAHRPRPVSPGQLALLCCAGCWAAGLGPPAELAQGRPRGDRRTLQSFTVRSLGRTERGGQLLKWARWPPPDSSNSPTWPEPRGEPCSAQGGPRGAGCWAEGLSLEGLRASRHGLLSRPGLRAPPLPSAAWPPPHFRAASHARKGREGGSGEEPNIVP